MIFTWPWALLSALAIPLLIALYFLRQKSRRWQVPSLLLWAQQTPQRAAGRRWEQLQRSWLLPLEILLLLLLALAASGPWLPKESDQHALFIILDDSLSMLAAGEGETSPRALADEALVELLRDDRHHPVQWILAGQRAQLLPNVDSENARRVPNAWRALAPRAALPEAIALAAELAESGSKILVISDHLAEKAVTDPHIRWWAFGLPRSNTALVGAGRSQAEDADDVLLQVSHFGSRPVSRQLHVVARSGLTSDAPTLTSRALRLDLAPGETQRHRLQVPSGAIVEATLDSDALDPDALEIDNRVILLPNTPSPVEVSLEIAEGPLRQLLQRTLEASGLARLVTGNPVDLRLTSQRLPTESVGDDAPWLVSVTAPATGSKPYLGPFILDTQHPLNEGLALEGVIWSADDTLSVAALAPTASPLISAGDIPLLIDHGRVAASRQLSLRWQPEVSNLQRTPNWPILWWNILQGCLGERPGVHPINGSLGAPITWNIATEASPQSATLELPSGTQRRLEAGLLEIEALEVGIHTLEIGERRHSFAVNALVPAESDLRQAVQQQIGEWSPELEPSSGRRQLLPYLVLLILGLTFVHLRLAQGDLG